MSVNKLGNRLFLDSGTLTPLLKKMESQGLITRQRGEQDERNVYIKLTKAGRELEEKCKDIPQKMMCNNIISREDAIVLVGMLHKLMGNMK